MDPIVNRWSSCRWGMVEERTEDVEIPSKRGDFVTSLGTKHAPLTTQLEFSKVCYGCTSGWRSSFWETPQGASSGGQEGYQRFIIIGNIIPKLKTILKIVISGKFRKHFCFLPAFYLIMCFLKALKFFGKRAILNQWELVSLGSVKIHFGKPALK